MAPDETCDVSRDHQVVDLSKIGKIDTGKKLLMLELQGRKASKRLDFLSIYLPFWFISMAGGFVFQIASCLVAFPGPEDGAWNIAMIVTWPVIFLLWIVVGLLLFGFFKLYHRFIVPPYGSAVREVPDQEPSFVGVVEGEPNIIAPLSSQECLAYSLSVYHKNAKVGPLMYVDSIASDFLIKSSDGNSVTVRQGRSHLYQTETAETFSGKTVRKHLDSFEHRRPNEETCFPFDYAKEEALFPGERVALYSPLSSIADPNGVARSFREPAMIQIPEGVVILRMLER
jgi:hypothetical protein